LVQQDPLVLLAGQVVQVLQDLWDLPVQVALVDAMELRVLVDQLVLLGSLV
jgi:hypothetical protein